MIEDDAMKIDPFHEIGEPFHIASNLPYNVGTALAVGWLSGEEWPPAWKSLTLMCQREVADRIVAKPGTDAYGRLAILAQWRCEARIAMPVHRSAFTPPPKVMSAVVHLTPKEQPAGVRMATLEALTGAAFGQRRKMLRQSLKLHLTQDQLAAIGIDAQARAEQLTVQDFVRCANFVAE